MRIRTKIMTPLFFTLVILSVVFTFNENRRKEKEIETSLSRTASVVEKLIQSEIRADLGVMETSLDDLSKDQTLLNYFKNNEREKIVNYLAATFINLKDKNEVSHFYLHRLNRTNFIRLHELNHRDDLISRNTLLMAEKTKAPTFGVEQGPTGASVLRVVYPLTLNNGPIGYIELGKEFQNIVFKIEKIIGVHALVITDKSHVKKDQWEKRNNKEDFKVSWDFLANQVIMASSLPIIPESLKALKTSSTATSGYVIPNLEVIDASAFFNVIVVPYFDTSLNKVADIVLLYDSSMLRYLSNKSATLTISTVLVVMLLLLGGFHIYLGKVERLINFQQQKISSTSKLASLGEMAGGIAHEINNPLAIIQLLTAQAKGMVTDKKFDQDELYKNLSKIALTSDRITKIITSLKSFARDGSNDPFAVVSVVKLINDTVELSSEKFKIHFVDFKLIAEKDVWIECRVTEISQALLNILNNAFDAAIESPTKWINVEIREYPESVDIRITNSGQLISDEVKKKLFEPFFTTKDVGKATGLGLSVSLGIINSHHGSITLDSEEINTCFVISLPKSQKKGAA